MFGIPTLGAAEFASERVPVPPASPVEGGGATTLGPDSVPIPLRFPRGEPPASDAVGGGCTTFALRSVPDGPRLPLAVTLGGGGTTSLAPKIRPTRLLMKDPLADCDGGGGTTVWDGPVTAPSPRVLCEMSAEGGGAITEGAGKFNLEVRGPARSGADTGGGTTEAVVICTGERESSRLMAVGAD